MKISRLNVIKHFLKQAGYVTDLVDQLIQQRKDGEVGEGAKKDIKYKQVPISIGSNAMVMMPPNVIKPDGSVDIIINFKGVNSPIHAAATGKNAVQVSVYEPEGGKHKFGNYSQYDHNFVNRAVNAIISQLQKVNPDKKIKRGKLTVTGWSAGGTSLKRILTNENKINGGVDEVIFSDALHSAMGNRMDIGLQPIINFAKKAAQDPTKKIILVSTGVIPGDATGQKYASTYETGKRISDIIGAKPQITNNQFYEGGKPAGLSQLGGFQWIQLYSPGKYKLNEMKKQHGDAYRWTVANTSNLLK